MIKSETKKWYFTFGSGQVHEGKFHVIEAVDWMRARELMISKFGTRWSMQYSEDEWELDKSDTSFMWYCRDKGLDPDEVVSLPQSRVYNLTEIK